MWARISRQLAREFLVRTNFETTFIICIEPEVVRTAIIMGMNFEELYGLHLLWARISRSCTTTFIASILYGLGTVSKVSVSIEIEEGTSTHFEVAGSNFQACFSRCTTTFNDVHTVWIFCKCGHENQGLNIYYSLKIMG